MSVGILFHVGRSAIPHAWVWPYKDTLCIHAKIANTTDNNMPACSADRHKICLEKFPPLSVMHSQASYPGAYFATLPRGVLYPICFIQKHLKCLLKLFTQFWGIGKDKNKSAAVV